MKSQPIEKADDFPYKNPMIPGLSRLSRAPGLVNCSAPGGEATNAGAAAGREDSEEGH